MEPTRAEQDDLSGMRERLRAQAFAARLRRHGLLPIALVIANVAAYVAYLALAPRTAGGDVVPGALILAGAKENLLVRSGEAWRLLASVWLHADATHLAVNCTGAYVLSGLAENVFGRARALVIYLVSGVAGAAASAALSAEPSVGASGAVFGLLGAVTTFAAVRVRDVPRPLRRVLLATMLVWLAVSVAYGVWSDTVDSAAHVGGLVAGVVLALAAGRRLPILDAAPRPASRGVAAAAAILLGASVAAGVVSIRTLRLDFELPAPRLAAVALPGVDLPWPSAWEPGAVASPSGGGLECPPGRASFEAGLATGGPVCARDGYGAVLFAGNAGALLPGMIFDASMTVEAGLAHTTDRRVGDVVRRSAMLDRGHAIVLIAPAWLAPKYDAMLDAMLRGVRFVGPPAGPVTPARSHGR